MAKTYLTLASRITSSVTSSNSLMDNLSAARVPSCTVPAALLRSVAVNAEQRSSGVGAQLVRAQLEAAKNLNATSVSLLTTTANTDSVKSLHLFLRTDCVQQRRKPVRCWCQRQERNP